MGLIAKIKKVKARLTEPEYYGSTKIVKKPSLISRITGEPDSPLRQEQAKKAREIIKEEKQRKKDLKDIARAKEIQKSRTFGARLVKSLQSGSKSMKKLRSDLQKHKPKEKEFFESGDQLYGRDLFKE